MRKASARPATDVMTNVGVTARGSSPTGGGAMRRARWNCASRNASVAGDSTSSVAEREVSAGMSPRSACRDSASPSESTSSSPTMTSAFKPSIRRPDSRRTANRSDAVPVTMATGALSTRRARETLLTGTTRDVSSASSTRASSAARRACSTVGVMIRQAGAALSVTCRLRSTPGRMAAAIVRASAGPCSTTCWLRAAPSRSSSPTSHSVSCRSAWPPSGQRHAQVSRHALSCAWRATLGRA